MKVLAWAIGKVLACDRLGGRRGAKRGASSEGIRKGGCPERSEWQVDVQ
jgi:hypothetical protein